MKHDDTSYTKKLVIRTDKDYEPKTLYFNNEASGIFLNAIFSNSEKEINQLIFTCSKWTTEALEKGVKYVQS